MVNRYRSWEVWFRTGSLGTTLRTTFLSKPSRQDVLRAFSFGATEFPKDWKRMILDGSYTIQEQWVWKSRQADIEPINKKEKIS